MFDGCDEIPLVNRSDEKAFHLTLVSKSDLWPTSSGGSTRQHMICNFAYNHSVVGDENGFVMVLILGSDEHRVGFDEIECAADKLAELLKAGEKLKTVYLFDPGEPLMGFPR